VPQPPKATAAALGNLYLVAIVLLLSVSVAISGFTIANLDSDGGPQASFELVDAEGEKVAVVHQSGDAVEADRLTVKMGGTRQQVADVVGTTTVESGTVIGPLDPDGASRIQLLWTDNSESYVLYTVEGYDGSASGSDAGAPSISGFDLANPSGQQLTVSFDADESLADVTVDISGAESATLDTSSFTESGGTYTASYSGSSDGTYTATLTTATDADGNDGASGQSDSVTVDTPVLASQGSLVYAGVTAVSGDGGTETSLVPSGVNALGPSTADIDGDGSIDLPYVDGDGDIQITDSDGQTATLVDSAHPSNPASSKTLLGVGSWQGSGTAVFYADGNNDRIYRITDGGTPVEVAAPGNGAQAVMGTGDIDGDGTAELLFADGSQQIRYLEPDGTVTKLQGGGVGSNNGIGVGQPPDFDGDGTVSAVLVDGSNNVKIVGAAEPDRTFTATNARKAPLTTADVDGDGAAEIIYVSADADRLKYVDDPRGAATIQQVVDANGDPVTAGGELGVVS
jgi:hypothetical protein